MVAPSFLSAPKYHSCMFRHGAADMNYMGNSAQIFLGWGYLNLFYVNKPDAWISFLCPIPMDKFSVKILMKRRIRKRFHLLIWSRSQRSLSLRKIKISHFSQWTFSLVKSFKTSAQWRLRERNKPRFLCFNVPILTKFWPPPRRTCPSVICRDCSFSSVNIILNDTHFRKGDWWNIFQH